MNTAHKGRQGRASGAGDPGSGWVSVVRAAGQQRPGGSDWLDTLCVRFIGVKSGTEYASATERAQLEAMPRPGNASVEVWRFPARCRHPLVERL